MLKIPDVPIIGAGSPSGLWSPGATIIGGQKSAQKNYLFIQNDTGNNPTSSWYVSKVDNNHYEMPRATAPKGAQYIGVFVCDIATDTRQSRIDASAAWTTSDASIVRINSVTAQGQAVISILTAGTATLAVEWGGMKSTLTITAV